MAAPVAIKKCSLEFLSYNWRREDEPVTTAAFTGWQSSFPVAVKTCMAHSHGSNWSLYQQMSGWEWDHCCSCNDERDCNVFQIFCSSACIKVISKTLCWSYQCLRTLQFVCHVGEVTETGIFSAPQKSCEPWGEASAAKAHEKSHQWQKLLMYLCKVLTFTVNVVMAPNLPRSSTCSSCCNHCHFEGQTHFCNLAFSAE